MAIAKISKGRGFGDLLAYLFKEKEAERGPEPRSREEGQEQGRQEERRLELGEALSGHERVEKDRVVPGRVGSRPDVSEREQQPGVRADGARGRPEPDAEGRGPRRGPPAGVREKEPRGRIIAGNMAGRDRQELEAEFEAVAARRPGVERKVLHGIVSLPAEDKVTAGTKVRIAERFADGMGLGNTPWVAVEHDEHDHHEIHFVASLVDLDGDTIPDSKDYERAEELMRGVEKEFGLREVEPSRDAMRRCPTQREVKLFESTGVLSTRMRLQAHVDEALGRGATAAELIERLGRAGVEVIPYVTDDGEARGVSYRLDGKVMRGRDLGRGYTWQGLQKDWPKHGEHRRGRMSYEHERDHEAVSRARNREGERRGRGTGSAEILGREVGGDQAEQPRDVAAELGAATRRLELGVTSSLSSLAEGLRADNLDQTAELLAEPVLRIGELVATLEAVGARADKKLEDLSFRGGQMQAIVNKQQEQIRLFESHIERANGTAEKMLKASDAGIDTMLDMWMRRATAIIISVSFIVLVAILAGTFLHRGRTSRRGK